MAEFGNNSSDTFTRAELEKIRGKDLRPVVGEEEKDGPRSVRLLKRVSEN